MIEKDLEIFSGLVPGKWNPCPSGAEPACLTSFLNLLIRLGMAGGIFLGDHFFLVIIIACFAYNKKTDDEKDAGNDCENNIHDKS